MSGSDDPNGLTGPGDSAGDGGGNGDDGFDDLAVGWRVWSEETGKIVLVYRPDVFDAGQFPAPCLPTIYVTRGQRSRRPGTDPRSQPGEKWYVTLFLEPEVGNDASAHGGRPGAIAAAGEIADRFARGAFDYRALYQVPREAYLDRLDELTGHED